MYAMRARDSVPFRERRLEALDDPAAAESPQGPVARRLLATYRSLTQAIYRMRRPHARKLTAGWRCGPACVGYRL